MASVSKRQWTHKGVKKEAWTVRYLDAKGVRRSRQFETKKAADSYRKEVERETHDGIHVAHTDTLTVAKAIEMYMESVNQRVRDKRMTQSSADSLEAAFRLHVVPEIGAVLFRELTIAQVEGVYRSLRRKGRGAWHARAVIVMLRMVEKFGHRIGFTKATVVMHALEDLKGIRPNKVKSPSIDVAMKILRRSIEFRPGIRSRSAAMVACCVHLAACCGMRMGEILSLDLDHIDLDRAEVRVRRNITKYHEVKGPKTRSSNRDLPLPPHLVAMLRAWLSTHYLENAGRFIFVSPSKQVPTGPDMNSRWKTLLRECGELEESDPLHFHSLRHFAGSWWLHQGVKIGDTSKMLGHSNPGVTMRVYAHALTDESERREQIRSASSLLLTSNDATATQSALSA